QGVAAAYDLARFGDAEQVLLVDARAEAAEAGANRVNRLVGRDMAVGVQGDVAQPERLGRLMSGVDAAISAVPYRYNVGLTRLAIREGFHLCDLGATQRLRWRSWRWTRRRGAPACPLSRTAGWGLG
ncbi:MAG: saccharopine dehydrogenase NADP-binding domain-containing protein, partial [Anaerolineae bacterium]